MTSTPGPVLVLSAVLLTATAASAGLVHRRQVRQDARIDQGVATGALTPGETRALRAEQRAIDGARDRALANDGRIGPVEARRLTAAQNRAGRHICRLTHNGRTR